jgi:hypothetical protein
MLSPLLAGGPTGPRDLPIIQQTDKLELVLNLHTANALGLKVPTPFLASADKVIK